jgi:hypothetical protein
MRPLLSLAFGVTLSAAPAFAQTSSVTPPPTTTSTTSTTSAPSTSSSFTALSPGNQKIAQALYDAQVVKTATPASSTSSSTTSTSSTSPSTTPSTSSTTTAPSKLTLDQIAAMKQSGRGWGEIFKQMKAQGLVQEKNLGQVISGSHRANTTTPAGKSSGYASTGPVLSTASGRTYVEAPKGGHGDGAGAHSDAGGAASGTQGSGAAASVSHGTTGNGAAHAGSGAAHGNSAKN